MVKSKMYTTSGKAWSDTYVTDLKLVKALGPFDVDPCCPEEGMPWRTAKRMFSPSRDGLKTPWGNGRAWMNPPYRNNLPWALAFVKHGAGVCLLNGRSTQTKSTQHVLRHCAAVFLPAQRLTFFKVSGEPHKGKWFNSILIGMTATDAELMARLPERGFPGAFLLGPTLGKI